MSNFFRHLLQRSFAPAPAIQPRPVSRFEPGILPFRGPATLGEDHSEIIAPAAAATSVPQQAALRVTPADSARQGAPSTVAPMPAEAATVRLLPPQATTPPAPAPVNTSASTLMPAASPPGFQPASKAPPAADSSPSRNESSPIVPTATREILTIQPTTNTLLIERAAPKPRDEFAVAQPSPRVEAAPAPSSVSSSFAAPNPTAPLAPRETAPSAPSVRVTIGRIDIRAVHEPAAAAPQRAATASRRPVLSLEDYLKQRAAS